MKIYAVLREQGGAHEVMSVWTTLELAQQETDRLNADPEQLDECKVREWETDVAGDGDAINW